MPEPITIETDLREILNRLDQRFDRLDQKLEKMDERLNRLETGQAAIAVELTAVKDDVKDLKLAQRGQIWALIGILSTAVVGTFIRFVLTSLPPF